MVLYSTQPYKLRAKNAVSKLKDAQRHLSLDCLIPGLAWHHWGRALRRVDLERSGAPAVAKTPTEKKLNICLKIGKTK